MYVIPPCERDILKSTNRNVFSCVSRLIRGIPETLPLSIILIFSIEGEWDWLGL